MKHACLLMGAGANTSFWSDSLSSGLEENGFFVITYDHRDSGFSDKVDFETRPFDVMDLAYDAISILDSLDIAYAHLIGHSMGGFIAQLLSIHFPGRVRSLASISSSTNSPRVPPPPARTWEIFKENNLTGHFEKDLEGFLPALILHGEEDYLVDKYGGIQTAQSIPDPELLVIPKIGHMLFNTEIKNSVEDPIIHFLLSQKHHG